MSSELGLLLKRDRPSIFLEGLVVNISLDRTKEQELALLAAIEADAFNTQAKYFENGILPPFVRVR